MAAPLENRRILWIDPDLLIVDKPSGILSQDAPGRRGVQLRGRVAASLEKRGEPKLLFAVHRLDEETSGSIAFARNEEARSGLEEIFRGHRAERVYHALVHGSPRKPSATIEHRLSTDEDGIVRVVARGGQLARMQYITLARLDGFSLLACRLDTGRRNQIRVQLTEIGSPLIGDRKYGRRRARIQAKRTMLHASALGFDHPRSGQRIEVFAPFPPEFTKLVGKERMASFEP